jgi:glutamine amidotransferase
MKVGIVCYGSGNVMSISNALNYLGSNVDFIHASNDLIAYEKLILPGVGAYEGVLKKFRSKGFESPLIEAVQRGASLLGICVGMQILFDYGEEFGRTDGLGILKGHVAKLQRGMVDDVELKIPHVGWNSVTIPEAQPKSRWMDGLFKGVNESTEFYFVHSYAAQALEQNDVVAEAVYGEQTLTASVQKGRVFGTQFHPEKSGEAGLNLLENFLYC